MAEVSHWAAVHSKYSFDDLDDVALRAYLDNTTVESKDVATIGALDKLAEEQFHTDMTDKDGRSRIETLFVSYKTLLRQHGLPWIVDDKEKLAVNHVLYATNPEPLRLRLESHLERSYSHFQKTFRGLWLMLLSCQKISSWLIMVGFNAGRRVIKRVSQLEETINPKTQITKNTRRTAQHQTRNRNKKFRICF